MLDVSCWFLFSWGCMSSHVCPTDLRDLETAYLKLVAEIQIVLNNIPVSVPATTLFHLSRPSRARSNTNPVPFHWSHKRITSALYALNSKYKILWECAELPIELRGGTLLLLDLLLG